MSDDNQRPGWTYLTGQQPYRKVIEAKNAAAEAWYKYELSIDEETGIGNQLFLDKAVKLQFEAERLSREWNRNYKERI